MWLVLDMISDGESIKSVSPCFSDSLCWPHVTVRKDRVGMKITFKCYISGNIRHVQHPSLGGQGQGTQEGGVM